MIMHSVLLFCAKSETVNVFFSFVVAVNNPPLPLWAHRAEYTVLHVH